MVCSGVFGMWGNKKGGDNRAGILLAQLGILAGLQERVYEFELIQLGLNHVSSELLNHSSINWRWLPVFSSGCSFPLAIESVLVPFSINMKLAHTEQDRQLRWEDMKS